MPVVREAFMILVMTGTRTSRYCLARGVGIEWRLQLFEAVFKISFSMLASVTITRFKVTELGISKWFKNRWIC